MCCPDEPDCCRGHKSAVMLLEADMKYLGAALLGVPMFLIVMWAVVSHL